MHQPRTNKFLLLLTLSVFLFLYLPIIVLVAFSFNTARINAVWMGFTLDWYRDLFRHSGILLAFKNSLVVSVSSAILSTLIGTLAAHAFAKVHPHRRFLYDASIYLPIITPDIVIGVALVALYSSINLELGFTTLLLSHLVFNSAYVTLIVLSKLDTYDTRFEDAARDLGATPFKTLLTIRLPLIFPAVAGAALLAFTMSFDDFLISFFTSGVGTTTLPIRIYSMTRFGVNPSINALSTVVLLFTAVSILAILWLTKSELIFGRNVGEKP